MAPTPLDLALFHKSERELYNDLVRRLGCDAERTKWVMALWLWYEALGHHCFIRHVRAYEDRIILRFVEEAEAALDRMAGVPGSSRRGDEMPLTNALMTSEPIDLGFFEYQRVYAISGVSKLYQNVCQIIFDDNLMAMVARDESHPANRKIMSSGLIIRPVEVEAMAVAVAAAAALEAVAPPPLPPPLPQAIESSLNPMARPWAPRTTSSLEDLRSMFITFSRGFPLSRREIMEFFTSRYGPCVEVVMIQKAAAGMPAKYGRIVFKSSSVIALVLNGQRTAKFVIKGKHLWARMYVPR